MTSQTADLVQQLADFFILKPEKLGVAVSGGSDSVALLCLLADWRDMGGPDLEAVSVDHGLRPEAAREVEGVAQLCLDLNVPHTTLRWQGWDGKGNLPDKARRARYSLMSDWASARGIQMVALGHTADDVAETFLMRLARGAGLDGLSSMSDTLIMGDHETVFLRPILNWSRQALRDVLQHRGQSWVDDPSNDDDRFERSRTRKALNVLADLGISPLRIVETSDRLRDARQDLSEYVAAAARDCVSFDSGDVLIPLSDSDPDHEGAWITDKDESFRRIIKAAIMWVAGSQYAPRQDALDQVLIAKHGRKPITLGGCHVVFQKDIMRITREWNAVSDLRVTSAKIWDDRWQLTGPDMPGLEIAALGEAGLKHCPDRKATGRPAVSLMASPAIWQGDTLIAAPLAGLENGWSARLTRDKEHYFSLL